MQVFAFNANLDIHIMSQCLCSYCDLVYIVYLQNPLSRLWLYIQINSYRICYNPQQQRDYGTCISGKFLQRESMLVCVLILYTCVL